MCVDRETGRIGAATASGYPFDVLSRVMYATAGSDAEPAHIVVSQAIGNPEHWNIGRRLARGESVDEALAAMLADDEQAKFRQVAVCAAGTAPVAHTGAACGKFAGHKIDAEHGLVVMGNALDGPEVLDAMLAALRETKGTLPERLVAALRAGAKAGGEVRPLLSAGYCTVPLAATGDRKRDKPLVVTVCRDNRDPLAELTRHIGRRRSARLLEEGIGLCGAGDFHAGLPILERSVELDPESPEAFLWLGYYRFQHTDGARGREALARAESRYAARLGDREAGRAVVARMLRKWGDAEVTREILRGEAASR
jgi:uncharacterized Ntn-hydrolase superfamily protein